MTDPTPADRSRTEPMPLVPHPDRDRLDASMPVLLTRFVGRAQEIAQVAALLRRDEVRLVTLTGPGGGGKTRLALRVAEVVARDFTDGVVFVALAAVREPDLVAPALAQALGVREAGERPLTEALAAYLRDRRLLLVLDNFEQVAVAAPLITDLLRASRRLAVLVTSRGGLRVSGEHVVSVPPLALPNPAAPAEQLNRAEAVQLFAERATAADADFALDDVAAGAVAAICARLDGLPLAIELAAAKTRLLPPPALLARLERRLPLLTGGARDQPDRLRTMRNAVAWSYDLLPEEARALFRRLAVFVGGSTLEAAGAVAGDGAGGDVFAGVEALADQSLVRRLDVVAGEPRFGMLETVREYGLEQLERSEEAGKIRRRHAAWCLALAEAAEPHLEGFGGNQAGWLARLDAELSNLRAALAWFHETGNARDLLRLVAVLDVYWFARPYLPEARHWLEAGLGLVGSQDAPADVRGMALHVLVNVTCFLGDHEAALARAEEELALASETGEPFALGRAQYGLGMACGHAGDVPRAAAHYAEAVPLLRRAGATSWVYLALAGVGSMRYVNGDVAGAIPLLDEALVLVRGVDEANPFPLTDRFSLSLVLGQRAHAALAQGDHALAARLFAEGLTLGRELGAERVVLGAVAGLAGVVLALGQPERAARMLGAVAAAAEVTGAGRIADTNYADRLVVAARARLGDGPFAAAFAVGRLLPFDEAVTEALAVMARAEGTAPGAHTQRDRFGLTPRERDVLGMVVAGKTDQQIADVLFVSRRTVTTHTSSLLSKLGVTSRTEAAAIAVREGIA